MAHRRVTALILICACVILLDQVSKYLVAKNLELHAPLNLAGSVVRLTYIRNPNAAFGFSFGSRVPMLPVALLAVLTLFLAFYKSGSRTATGLVGLAMILGGAVGNLVDRIRLHEVIDFMDVGFGRFRWPVFNVADSCVTVGVILLMAASIFIKPQRAPVPEPTIPRD